MNKGKVQNISLGGNWYIKSCVKKLLDWWRNISCRWRSKERLKSLQNYWSNKIWLVTWTHDFGTKQIIAGHFAFQLWLCQFIFLVLFLEGYTCFTLLSFISNPLLKIINNYLQFVKWQSVWLLWKIM